jgi:regulator of sigma E protease
VGGVAITSSEQLQRLVRNMPLVETEVVVDRKGRILRFHGAPEVRVNPKTRQPEEDPSTHKPLQLIGIMPVPSTGPRVPLGTSMRNGVRMFGHAFADLWDTVRKGQIAENVGGPVEMYRTTRTVSQLPVWLQVDLITQLSISLAVFNLLPIPVLDGGHLFLLAIEVVRRRRLTADAVRVAQVVGLAVIGVLFVLIMYKDLTRLLTGS